MRIGAIAGAALGLLLLAGCNDAGSPSSDSSGGQGFAQAKRTGDAKLAYRHELTIGLAREAIARHFAAARDRCLNETALRCELIRSSVREGAGDSARSSADLEVRLPHDSVTAYVAFVTSPLPGEKPADVILRNQTTRSEDLTEALADNGRRLAQLGDYRDRLNALSARSDTRVEDLIKIANELSQVQTQIEDLEGKKRGFEERVATEIVAVDFRSDGALDGGFVPVANAWERGGRTLGESAGAALGFAIASLPWLPLVALFVLLIRALWRLRRGKRQVSTESNG